MRAHELLTEEELAELDWKKAAATGALGLGLAMGSGQAAADQAPDVGVNAKPVAAQTASAGTQALSKVQYSTAINSTATLAAIAKSGMLGQFLSPEQVKNMSSIMAKIKADPRYEQLNHHMGYSAGQDVVQDYQKAKDAHHSLADRRGNSDQTPAVLAQKQKNAYEVLKNTARESYKEVVQSMGAAK